MQIECICDLLMDNFKPKTIVKIVYKLLYIKRERKKKKKKKRERERS